MNAQLSTENDIHKRDSHLPPMANSLLRFCEIFKKIKICIFTLLCFYYDTYSVKDLIINYGYVYVCLCMTKRKK